MAEGISELLDVLNRIANSLEEIAAALKIQVNSSDQHKPESDGNKLSEALWENNEIKRSNENNDDSINEELGLRKQFIFNYLNKRNIKVKNVIEEDEGNNYLDNISNFMGSRYAYIREFYINFKRCLSTGVSFRMDMKNKEPLEISYTCQLAKMLHEIAFLTDYKYQRSPKYILTASPCNAPSVINFMSGKWLERYTRNEVIKALKEVNSGLLFSYLHGAQIILPNGTEAELDLLFEIEQQIFWFEAKTGDYQKYIHRYERISDILGLDYDHCFMILTDITAAGAEALRSVFKMNVLPIEKLPEELRKIFGKLFAGHLNNI